MPVPGLLLGLVLELALPEGVVLHLVWVDGGFLLAAVRALPLHDDGPVGVGPLLSSSSMAPIAKLLSSTRAPTLSSSTLMASLASLPMSS